MKHKKEVETVQWTRVSCQPSPVLVAPSFPRSPRIGDRGSSVSHAKLGEEARGKIGAVVYNDGVGVVPCQETATSGRVSFPSLKRTTSNTTSPRISRLQNLNSQLHSVGPVSDRLKLHPFGRMRVPIVRSIWATPRTSTKRLVMLVLTDLDKGRHWAGCRGSGRRRWDGMGSMVDGENGEGPLNGMGWTSGGTPIDCSFQPRNNREGVTYPLRGVVRRLKLLVRAGKVRVTAK